MLYVFVYIRKLIIIFKSTSTTRVITIEFIRPIGLPRKKESNNTQVVVTSVATATGRSGVLEEEPVRIDDAKVTIVSTNVDRKDRRGGHQSKAKGSISCGIESHSAFPRTRTVRPSLKFRLIPAIRLANVRLSDVESHLRCLAS